MSNSVEQQLLEFVQRYGPQAGAAGPEMFVREVLGVEPDDWQLALLRAYGAGERRITARSCHGVGKTACLSWIVWHSLCCRFPQKTVATAPTASQIYDALYAEVLKWGKRLPLALYELFEIKSDRIELKAAPEESFFSVRTSRAEKPEALAGIHCEGGYVTLMGDEASAIPEAIFEAASGSMSGHGATTILTGNPTRGSGFFFDTHNKLKPMWVAIHVSCVRTEDDPPPSAETYQSRRVTPDFPTDIAARYGRDSNAFRVRCLGEFPKADDDTVIPFEFVESARQRDIVVRPGLREVWGVDVARFGDDKSALVRRNKLSVVPGGIHIWKQLDNMQVTGRIKALWDERPAHLRPEKIIVDAIGWGAGVADRLKELGLPAKALNVSESAASTDKYRNLRSELWFLAREWLGTRESWLPTGKGGAEDPAEILASELTWPRYDYTSGGKILVESKKDMKSRGLHSPNVADAFIQTFAVNAAVLVHGASRGGSGKGKPLSRGLRTVP